MDVLHVTRPFSAERSGKRVWLARLSFSMDEKKAEARPLMGTIFLVCSIFFVMKVTRCGALAVSVQSLVAYRFKTKSRKNSLKYHFGRFSILRNFDNVLRIRYLKCQPFLAEARPSCSGV